MVSLLQRVPFSNAGVPAQQKETKRLCPGARPARWSSGYLRYGGAKDQKQQQKQKPDQKIAAFGGSYSWIA
jgi:hypothetical protein